MQRAAAALEAEGGRRAVSSSVFRKLLASTHERFRSSRPASQLARSKESRGFAQLGLTGAG
jgi:hypothetical protein